MALFLRPANVQKNIAANFELNLEELAGLEVIPAGYYKDRSNWKDIRVRVMHKTSDQKSLIHYSTGSNTGTLLVSDTARAGEWKIESIVIEDFDRGQIVVGRHQIPNASDYDFFVISAATHGDLLVGNGEVVEVPANGTRQYGDIIVEAGGTLKLADGGGILELEALHNCIINGSVLANNGKHTGGTWSKTSALGETLSHAVVQPQGGKGGAGESFGIPEVREPASGHFYNRLDLESPQYWSQVTGQNGMSWKWNGENLGYEGAGPFNKDGWTYYRGDYAENTFIGDWFGIYRIQDGTGIQEGGSGGSAFLGNGGAGGRATKFIAMAGGNAIDVYAGQGVAQAEVADEYGEDGVDSSAPVNTAGGGFRGAHGQCIYIKAPRIQGSGVIDASGQKGGDGGNGGEYLAEGELFANGPGGGGAGGCGGKVWLRAKKGTPALTIRTQGGERGSRGIASPGAGEAEHGQLGLNGSYNFSIY